MSGIKAMFKNSQIMRALTHFKKEVDFKSLSGLHYIGEQFVNNARELNTYLDNTGNLRSSIGYIILNDGDIVDMNFKSKGADGETGKLKGIEIAAKVASLYPSGFVLIGVAGMEYARYVESMGLDVITGSQPESSEIKALFNEIKF
ncbi:hypothetical protein [Flavicella sp.]|uniref:hypothetical protein n=1 Tax=Flavicella sp. TaxID=2957742 RepID=UPI0030199E49